MVKVVFSPHLNFRKFEKIKHFFMLYKNHMKPTDETDIIVKKTKKKTYTIDIPPIELDE
jgi:hypothetical protein